MEISKRLQRLLPQIFIVLGITIAGFVWLRLIRSLIGHFGNGEEAVAGGSVFLVALVTIPSALLIALIGAAIGEALHCLSSIVLKGWSPREAVRAHFKDRPMTKWNEPVLRA